MRRGDPVAGTHIPEACGYGFPLEFTPAQAEAGTTASLGWSAPAIIVRTKHLAKNHGSAGSEKQIFGAK
jgi:hypothetical protein